MTERLHLGSGTVYLTGYINVDLPGDMTFLASEHPELVEAYRTTEDAYYARSPGYKTMSDFPEQALSGTQPYLCDRYGSWFNIPCRSGNANEILSRATFEHLSLTESHRALDEAGRVLCPGGLLRLSVPDHETCLRKFVESGDKVWIRQLLGPRTSEGGYHLVGYTLASLRAVVEKHGFTFVGEEENPHAYPMLCCRWKKAVR